MCASSSRGVNTWSRKVEDWGPARMEVKKCLCGESEADRWGSTPLMERDMDYTVRQQVEEASILRAA